MYILSRNQVPVVMTLNFRAIFSVRLELFNPVDSFQESSIVFIMNTNEYVRRDT